METLRDIFIKLRRGKQAQETNPRAIGINTQLQATLQRTGGTLSMEDRYIGKPAIFETSDEFTSKSLEKIIGQQANGYLIGVGAGGTFSLLEGFSKGPMGIVIVDINPYVVAAARIMVGTLRNSEDFYEFSRNFFALTSEEYKNKVNLVARADALVAKALKNWIVNGEDSIYTPMASRHQSSEPITGGRKSLDISETLRQHFVKLKQLASEDNIAVCLADMSNYKFINAIKSMPEFNKRTNMIYLSNFIWLAGHQGKKPEDYSGIGMLDEASKPPVYVYACGRDLTIQVTREFDDALASRETSY